MKFGSYKDSTQLLNQRNSANCQRCFCASPFIKYVLPSFLVVLLILILSHFGLLIWMPLEDPNGQATCHLQPTYHVPCAPGRPKINKDECLELGCCWRDDLKRCYHSFPSRYGYMVETCQMTSDGLEGNITASKKYSPTGKPMRETLSFYVSQMTENHIRISFRTNAKSQSDSRRFTGYREQIKTKQKKVADYGRLFGFLSAGDETGITEFSSSDNSSTKVLLHEPNFSLTIINDKDEIVLTTARGPFIMTDNYWELTLYLANGSSLQGLSALELNGTTNWIYNNENRTIKPVLLALRSNVTCQLDYQAPLEIQVLNGSNLVILRGISIPDDGLIFNVHINQNHSQTIQKLSNAHENWQLLSLDRLGLHICPENHENLKSAVESLKKLVESTESGYAPWDSHCLSRRHLGLTLEHDTNLSLITEALKILGSRTLAAHLTPMLRNKAEEPSPYLSLKKESCLLRNETGTYIGMYDSQGVVYPEWSKKKTREIAREFFDNYVKKLQLGFIVLRDAWPRDDIPHNMSDESFDYLPEGLRRLMSNGTVPFDLQNHRHYTSHNAYASNFANFVGSKGIELRGHECNSPNIEVNWSSLRSILEIGVTEAMAGEVPNIMYVCGANPMMINDELCVRWYSLAVVWPRILSVPEKSPFYRTRLSRTSAARVAKLLKLRATLTTYHRTTFASFIKEGMPIFADTRLYFPDDKQLPRTASQFLWGDSILVGLVLLPRHNHVPMWIPSNYPWKHMQGGSPVGPSTNSSIPVTVVLGEVALLVRPGRIIPVHQETADNSMETSLKNLNLLANPICDSSNICQAEGRVYFGDDKSTGKFLIVNFQSNATLAFSNVLDAKEVACGVNPKQTSIFQSFLILGATNYTIDLNLCKLQGDVNVELN